MNCGLRLCPPADSTLDLRALPGDHVGTISACVSDRATVNFPVFNPHRCRFCGAQDSLTEDILVKADLVVVTWRCTACDTVWEPSVDEQLRPDRRSGPPDRRRISRDDRRRR